MSAGSGAAATIHKTFHDHYLEIFFEGVIEPVSIHTLNQIFKTFCRDPDNLHNLYNYRRVSLHIESPGGSVPALFSYLDTITAIRRACDETGESLILETRAGTICASAAAIMLSFGTLGYRSASSYSTLLYHDARSVLPAGTALTSKEHLTLYRNTTRFDHLIGLRLLQHIYPQIDPEVFADLIDFGDMMLNSQNDSAVIEKLGKAFGVRASRTTVKTAGRVMAVTRLKVTQSLEQLVQDNGDEHIRNVLNITNPQQRHQAQIGWTCARLREFQELFHQDRQITIGQAADLKLIDPPADRVYNRQPCR